MRFIVATPPRLHAQMERTIQRAPRAGQHRKSMMLYVGYSRLLLNAKEELSCR